MASILNQSFKDWSAHQKYPMADDSDFTCTDGRRIPLSFFVDASLYPAVEDNYYISYIDNAVINIASQSGWNATAALKDYARGWIPIIRYESVVGSLVINENDWSYVMGMVNVRRMSFRPGRFSFAPGVVRSFCKPDDNLTPLPTFFGLNVDSVQPAMNSERYSLVSENTYDMSDETEETHEHTPVTRISVKGTSYKVGKSGHLNIRTPIWCDDQFITQGLSIVLHRRGI